MREAKSLSTWIAVATAIGAAAYVVRYRTVLGWLPAHDLYAYFYPKMLYALASLHEGGRGLLWNPFQNCGQPFFGISQTGLLYPPYLFFLVLDPEHALRAVLSTQLVIGGAGAYLLGRELGARPVAAIAGALAFEMGNAMVRLTISSPTHSAPYAWMPAALLCCERLLRAPDLRRAFALAVVLAIAILPGMPQTVFFTYQLIVLRVLWEFATRRVTRPAALLGLLVLGLGLPILLSAVQLFPEMEVARQSIRSAKLTAREISPHGPWNLQQLRLQFQARSIEQPFLLVPCLMGVASLFAAGTRRLALFYLTAAGLAVLLACGPGTSLYDWYSRLPAAGLFREPARFLWVASFCLAALTALGAEALSSRSTAAGWYRSVAMALLLALPLVAVRAFTTGGLSSFEWSAAGLAIAAGFVAFWVPRVASWTPAVLVAALLLELLLAPTNSNLYLLPTEPTLFSAQPIFGLLRQLTSAEDRIYLLHENPSIAGYGFMDKTASLFRLPAVRDYEPLLTRRYAEFSIMLRSGHPLRSLNDAIYGGPKLDDGFSRRLLDLAATRYLVVAKPYVSNIERIAPSLRHAYALGDLTVFENPDRLPRAFYVPRMEVVADAQKLLDRLANGTDDLRQVAFVEAPPPTGFTGAAGDADASAIRFARNDPEHVVLDVDAPARGFLVLSDQYFPGWFASVNGRSAPIQRANYAFRLVEVPAGQSTVEFWYSPRSLWLGAGVSALSLVAVGAMLWWSRRRGS